MSATIAEVDGVELDDKLNDAETVVVDAAENEDVSPLSLCTGYSTYCSG